MYGHDVISRDLVRRAWGYGRVITARCDLGYISAITALCVLADREHAVDLPTMDDLRLRKQVVDALEMHLQVNRKS